jgi:hypothetical protein
MKFYLNILLLAAAFACTPKEETTDTPEQNGRVYFNDFEASQGWGDCDHKSITNQMAHSGRFAVKLDQENEFGMGFSQPLGKLTGEKPKKIELEAWVYLSARSVNSVLVFNVVSPANTNSNVVYEELNLQEKAGEIRKWTKVKQVFELPDSIAFTDVLKVYPWRHSASQTSYIDDLKITVIQ